MTRTRFLVLGLLVLAVAVIAVVGLRNKARLVAMMHRATYVAPPPARPLTAAEDRRRLMDLLHIKALRPGVDGRNPHAPNAANYDEARANPYRVLPDLLKTVDGKTVDKAEDWWRVQRPAIADDFEREVYGQLQTLILLPQWKTVDTVPETVGAQQGITRHLVFHVADQADARRFVDMKLTITLPAKGTGPFPVILQLASGKLKPPPGMPPSTWREQVLAKGWGTAVLDVDSVQPDNGADLVRGIIGIASHGKPRGPADWGVLRVWAWGASRVMDYFESDATINAQQVGIEGHSRYGKAALIAMAYDSRFSVAFISSSGAGGAALLRRNFGERLENLAGVGEYHWFAGNFLKYAGPQTANDLPVDAHGLIAMCAPRPVFIGAGSKGDMWVDARGMFLAEVAAGAVYRLLGARDLGTTTMPPVGTALLSGDLAFRQHEDGHTPEPNWPSFLEFASRYLHVGGKQVLPHPHG
ncbi:MAG TPA: hypothetical protein VNU97_02770 [Rhizomicrobium sp.]|jgi:hypothetical protein|nr:hypothetical protein [Rhizomicrobium sp.]